ncbi:hypothetical protein BSLA_03f1506 [Burkholderia stabilis]|nr:hypothetical protein BSLA_03f1506 [Burkholderia stabilis]
MVVAIKSLHIVIHGELGDGHGTTPSALKARDEKENANHYYL